MPRKSKGAPLTDRCTAEVTSIAFVSMTADANRKDSVLISVYYFSIFPVSAYPPNFLGYVEQTGFAIITPCKEKPVSGMPKPNLNPKGSEQMKPKHIASLAFVAIISAGSAFAEQPDKWVRYVESTGSQYVDTGITGRWNTKIEAKVEWMELKDSAFIASRTGEWGTSNVDGKMYFCYCENANGVMFAAQDVGESIGEYYGSSYWYRRFEKNRVYTYTSEFTATNGAGKASN